MDQQIENRCLGLAENYRILSAGSKLEFQEMVLACAGIYLAAGMEPDMGRVQECKKLLKSRAGLFSNFRGSDELLVRCKMALADDPALYFERLEREYQRIKTFFRNDLPFAAVMAVSGRDATSVYAEAEEIYALLNGKLKADKDTMQMLSHILAIRSGRAEEKCEKLCALAEGLKAAGHSLGRGSRLAILGILADSGFPTDALVERISETDDFLKQYKPFRGLFGVGKDCRRMFAVQMVHSALPGEDSPGASALLTASVELAIITMILMMIVISSTASYHASSH